jgi:hypothetical protein
MAPTKCRKCKRSHPPPRGKKCHFVPQELEAELELPADLQPLDDTLEDDPARPPYTPPRSPTASPTRAMMELILESVNEIGSRLTTLERTSSRPRTSTEESRSPSLARPRRPPQSCLSPTTAKRITGSQQGQEALANHAKVSPVLPSAQGLP